MSNWLVILVATIVLLLVTWYAGEWACHRIAARYAARRRLWRGGAPEDRPDALRQTRDERNG